MLKLFRAHSLAPEKRLAVIGDTLLLANRQIKINNFTIPFKIGAFVCALEGHKNAHDVKKLMTIMLEEKNISLEKLRKINFSKMSLAGRFSDYEITPIRNCVGVVATPINTPKTRDHLNSVFSQQTAELDCILNDRRNYVRSTLPPNKTEGATFSEDGWQEIVYLSLIQPLSVEV